MKATFPFTAICKQDDFKLALLLCMIDPGIGGVLALGDKGTGKTTTVRALSALMKLTAPDFAFVNLPIGATEDRVLGSVRLDVLISEKKLEVHKGLLANAHKGVLYIDEVNLLNDYLMDVLLDAASGGGYYLERDSLSQWFESQFCLIGTMNPEEGELRPQLLDRFGLSASIKTPADAQTRIEIVNRRLEFDADPLAFTHQYAPKEKELAEKISAAKNRLKHIRIPYDVKEEIAATCINCQAEGLRADILLLKATRANAAFHSREEVTTNDVQKVAHLVLAHRTKAYTQNRNSRQKQEPEASNEEKEGYTESIRSN